MTVAMVIGQTFIGGILGDRLNKRVTIIVALFGHTIALLLLAYAFNLAMILGFVIHQRPRDGRPRPADSGDASRLLRAHVLRDDHGLLVAGHDGRG